MKFKLLAMLILAVLSGTVSVSAYESFLDGKYVNISNVEFTADSQVIEMLPETGTVTVSMNAKKGAMSDPWQKVSLVAAVYTDGKLTGIQTAEFELSDNYTKPISVDIDAAGADELKVFVCDSLEDGCPLAAKSLFSQKRAELLGIMIEGTEIEDFSVDKYVYDVTIPAGYTSFPEITPRLDNAAVKCKIDISGSFPLGTKERAKAVIKCGDKEYTINMSQEQPQIMNLEVIDEVKASGAIIDETAGVVGGLAEPVYSKEPTEPIKISTNSATGEDMTEGYGYANVKGVPFFSDRGAYPIAFLPDAIKDALMIQTKINFQTRVGSKISFDINRTATVYASVTAPAELVEAGFEPVAGMNISWISNDADRGRLYRYAAYKKHYKVTPGENVRVDIPHGCVNAFVVFDNGISVENAVLKARNGEVTNLPLIDVRNAEYTDWKDPAYKEGIGNYTYAAKFISDKMSDTYMFATDFPKELTGAVGVAVPENPRKYNPSTTNKEFIGFDIKEDAEVYVAYEAAYEKMQWMEEAGFEDVSDSVEPIKIVTGEDTEEYTTKLYKKTVNVIPGETVKVDIGGFPKTENDSNIPLMIFVKKADS